MAVIVAQRPMWLIERAFVAGRDVTVTVLAVCGRAGPSWVSPESNGSNGRSAPVPHIAAFGVFERDFLATLNPEV
jgi:hypothetical protein